MSKKQKRTIAIDFDGVLHRYSGYNNGLLDGPIAGAREGIAALMSVGMTCVVFTTRDPAIVCPWLQRHGFPALEVTSEKRPFWLILDDRAMPFSGVWGSDTVRAIQAFEPYWLGGKPAAGE